MNPAKRRAVIQAGNLRSRCSQIFLRLQAANPHPTTELEYETPFELLVAAMLSAQISYCRALFGVQFYSLPWRLI